MGLAIVDPDSAGRGQFCAADRGGLNCKVAIYHCHVIVTVRNVVCSQYIGIRSYFFCRVGPAVGNSSQILFFDQIIFGSCKYRIFFIKELLRVIDHNGRLSWCNFKCDVFRI